MSAAYLKGPATLPTINIAHWCQGKHRYESPMTAAQVAARSPHPLETYRCGVCGGFHIGSARAESKIGNHKMAKGLIR